MIDNIKASLSKSEYLDLATTLNEYGYKYEYVFYDTEGHLWNTVTITGTELLEQL